MSGTSKNNQKSDTLIPKDILCKIHIHSEIINNNINGAVEIITDNELMIQQALLELNGVVNSKWQLNKTYCIFPKIYFSKKIAKGREVFYLTRHTICGGTGLVHKHTGQQLYPFQCHWPTRLPGTWIGEFGEIKYHGKVIIKLPNDEIYIHTEDIIVSSRRDLKMESHLLFESRLDCRRTFFTANQWGVVSVSVWIPLCGIAAGQSIPVLCTIHNNSEVHFGGLIFVLTKIEIYKATKPLVAVKKIRTDICRVARMVDIYKGKHEYYAVLQTEKDTVPTNQFFTCQLYQTIYELWVSVQGTFLRYTAYGYPNIDTPGIPIIIGTEALLNYDIKEITMNIFKTLFDMHPPIVMEELPFDEEVKELIYGEDSESSAQRRSTASKLSGSDMK